MTDMQTLPEGSSTVVGYFSNGEDAHRAIHALLDQGFEAEQIGAAFHTGSSEAGGEESVSGATIETAAKEVGYPRMEPSDTGVTTTAAGYTAQTPAFGGGYSTGMAGAGRPGPISGSDISHLNLPHELESELPHDSAETDAAGAAGAIAPGTPSFTETRTHHENWLDKLGHLFGGHKHRGVDAQNAGQNLVSDSSQNFGTGEGHLGVAPTAGATANYRRPYSQMAFERSFSGFGMGTDHSRQLALRLSKGGAIVTVSVTGRIADAERILEANNGSVRFDSAPFENDSMPEAREIAVFGRIEQSYPSYEEVEIPRQTVHQDR